MVSKIWQGYIKWKPPHKFSSKKVNFANFKIPKHLAAIMVQVKKLKKKIFFNATGMHNTAGTTVYPDLAHLYGGLDIKIDPPYYPVTEWPSRR